MKQKLKPIKEVIIANQEGVFKRLPNGELVKYNNKISKEELEDVNTKLKNIFK